jgi:hypothetical protein
VMPRLIVRTFGNWQIMRDGLQLPPTDEELKPIHDRLARASYLNAGAAATLALKPDLDLTLSGFGTVSGRNFHAVRVLVTGLTWKFGGAFKIAGTTKRP